ncbi:DNA-binding barrel domain superfamily [Sesbania bispinosa]|nr:DNA-binding barrel domain superfamily [Sesbania bispinosa]
MVHVPFPHDFYHPRQNLLGNRIELVDQSDHRFTIRLLFGSKSVVMWEFAEHLKRFYNFDKTVYLYLKYEGGIRFSFEIRDEDSIETLTPALVHRSGRIGVINPVIVQVISGSNVNDSDSNKNGGGGIENQSRHVNFDAGRRVMNFHNQTGPVNEHVAKRVISFEKVITKSQSKAGQPLPLPRKFVQEFIRKNWTELSLQVGDGRFYNCSLLRRKGSEKDCHLGKPWYKLVSDMRLRKGDKVVFKTIFKGLNSVNVKIIRKGN